MVAATGLLIHRQSIAHAAARRRVWRVCAPGTSRALCAYSHCRLCSAVLACSSADDANEPQTAVHTCAARDLQPSRALTSTLCVPAVSPEAAQLKSFNAIAMMKEPRHQAAAVYQELVALFSFRAGQFNTNALRFACWTRTRRRTNC